MDAALVLNTIHQLFSWIGVAIISLGVLKALMILVAECFTKKPQRDAYHHARMVLCQGIVFGLEFMVAADVIKTMIVPDQKNILLLGGLVLIRTVLSYALSVEITQLKGGK